MFVAAMLLSSQAFAVDPNCNLNTVIRAYKKGRFRRNGPFTEIS